MRLPVAALLALVVTGCAPNAPKPEPHAPPPSLATAMEWEAASRGRAIALVGCASCHAVDPTGASPYAAAPPFRDIVKHRSLDNIETAMAQGLVTTHPEMPPYTFRASEIDDLIAYLDTLRETGPVNARPQRRRPGS